MIIRTMDILYEVGDEVIWKNGIKGKVISKYCVQTEMQVEFDDDSVEVFDEFGKYQTEDKWAPALTPANGAVPLFLKEE